MKKWWHAMHYQYAAWNWLQKKKKVSKLHTDVMLLPGECHFESNHLGMGENADKSWRADKM